MTAAPILLDAMLGVVESVDERRQIAFDEVDIKRRAELGQFGTPAPVARLMASMVEFNGGRVRLLDAGAGVGSLTAAVVEAACAARAAPVAIDVTAVELEPRFTGPLEQTLERCAAAAAQFQIAFRYTIIPGDFVDLATDWLSGPLLNAAGPPEFDLAVLNPPYKKLRATSPHRAQLDAIGLKATNLYAAFVALSLRVLAAHGQLVAITPRSFCNGPYFAPFRHEFLGRARLRRIHVFDSRNSAFKGDAVLQENVIVSAEIGRPRTEASVQITSSSGEPGASVHTYSAPYSRVVARAKSAFIYLVTNSVADGVATSLERFTTSVGQLGVTPSTGRVVDFRARELLRDDPVSDGFPLIYPTHLRDGLVQWPLLNGRKPNGLTHHAADAKLLVPPGLYPVVKRFSSKEQARRIVASLYDSDEVAPNSPVGFENHINYFHAGGSGLTRALAIGIVLYLNSSIVDAYFRLFSGHTQVNATDLKALPYPTRAELETLGEAAGTTSLSQAEVDSFVQRVLY